MSLANKLFAISLTTFTLLPTIASAEYVFAAPPRENLERGIRDYKPIADYLSKVIGTRFTYYHPNTWSEYSAKMHAESFDLVFDGPHFVDWRVDKIGHNLLLKLPKIDRWTVIARVDDNSINNMHDVIGKKACAPGSPNFGMLNMMSHYSDPNKQPVHVKVKGWNNVYNGVKEGKCDVGVLPHTNHLLFDRDNNYTKSIHKHLPYPNQGMTYGPRISPQLAIKIKAALLSDEGQEAMIGVRKRYAAGKKFVSAENEEYDGVRLVLKRANNFTYEKSDVTALIK